MKIVYQKHLWKTFYQFHISTLELLFPLESHVKVGAIQCEPAALLLQTPGDCGFSEHIKGIPDSFLQLRSDAVPFYSSCSGCYTVLVHYGCILYHLFFPGISKQGNNIIWDLSLLNIFRKSPVVISLYEARVSLRSMGLTLPGEICCSEMSVVQPEQGSGKQLSRCYHTSPANTQFHQI